MLDALLSDRPLILPRQHIAFETFSIRQEHFSCVQKHPLKLLLWNVYWAAAQTKRGEIIADIIDGYSPDVACFSEVTEGILPQNGNSILSEADYGYQPLKGRKVALWCNQAWTEKDTIGSIALPPGRFASGVTGGIRFVGICIPWFDAPPTSGRRDRKQWQEHRIYIDALRPILERYLQKPESLCLLGDFNQRIPRKNQPADVAVALQDLLDIGFHVATAGCLDSQGGQLIDHIATCGKQACRVDSIIPKKSPGGVVLSDHVGITASLM